MSLSSGIQHPNFPTPNQNQGGGNAENLETHKLHLVHKPGDGPVELAVDEVNFDKNNVNDEDVVTILQNLADEGDLGQVPEGSTAGGTESQD